MSENPPNGSEDNPDEDGADAAGKLEEQDAGGYGGPGPEAEVAPGFEGDNSGNSDK